MICRENWKTKIIIVIFKFRKNINIVPQVSSWIHKSEYGIRLCEFSGDQNKKREATKETKGHLSQNKEKSFYKDTLRLCCL